MPSEIIRVGKMNRGGDKNLRMTTILSAAPIFLSFHEVRSSSTILVVQNFSCQFLNVGAESQVEDEKISSRRPTPTSRSPAKLKKSYPRSGRGQRLCVNPHPNVVTAKAL